MGGIRKPEGDSGKTRVDLRFAETADLEELTLDEGDGHGDHGLALVVIAHPERRSLGRRYDLTRGHTLRIGRSPECEIDLPDAPLLSREHALVRWDDSGIWVEDLNSTNGTFVNEARIEGRHILTSGDRVQCGGVHFKFLMEHDVEAAYFETLHRLALQDPLTGIANRRLFDEELQREFARALRHGRNLSLILFDIDNFKEINDRQGHACGDLVLQHIARTGREQMRREELFGRLGGDEFGILCPEADSGGAAVLAERLRSAISCAPVTVEGEEAPPRITCSFGVAQFDPAMETAEALFEAADQALYRSKNGGRNRISIHSGHGEGAPIRPGEGH